MVNNLAVQCGLDLDHNVVMNQLLVKPYSERESERFNKKRLITSFQKKQKKIYYKINPKEIKKKSRRILASAKYLFIPIE